MASHVQVNFPASIGSRQQKIKTSPAMLLKTVVTTVCEKQKLGNPDDYTLIYNRKPLDLSLSCRFANLPAGAKLELVKAKPNKSGGLVAVAVQLESGGRITGKYPAGTSLWDILRDSERQSQGKLAIFGRRAPAEVNGVTKLGKFIQILNKAGPDAQPMVSLQPLCVVGNQEFTGSAQLKSTTLHRLGITSGSIVIRVMFRPSTDLDPVVPDSPLVGPPTTTTSEPKVVKDDTTGQAEHTPTSPVIAACLPVPVVTPQDSNSTVTSSVMTVNNSLPKRHVEVFNPVESNLVPAAAQVDVPDSFYRLTPEDAKLLIQQQKQQRERVENAAFKTQAMRDKEVQSQQRKYPETSIRFRFPDRHQVQATFRSSETVGDMYTFLTGVLLSEYHQFTLYTTPPHRNLDDLQATLYQAQLAPASLVYVTFAQGSVAFGSYLKREYTGQSKDLQVSDPLLPRLPDATPTSTSTSTSPVPTQPTSVTTQPPATSHSKVPKWFKMGKR
ncbi:hypothetical protein IWQ62_000078 [Dispira parvispora]|uniref:UBX domain-containing protein n=1 Tax=Dispira parvispora TaxID=1520584 RepID=A0A9W8B105_9FUNG|nr:hypothetical protein IWQ62_000078 [Dispira parvispora]